MDRLRLLYTTVLACLLILSGCFGATVDQGESQTTPSTTPTTLSVNSPPQVTTLQASHTEAIEFYNSSTGALEGATGYWVLMYHAMMDIDGTINSSGWDINLDGVIDFSTTANKAFTNITIPVSEWISSPTQSSSLITSVAFIATDNDGWISTEIVSMTSNWANRNQQESPDLYQYRARDHPATAPSAGTTDNLMILEFMQAPADLNWANINVQITGDDGVPHTCMVDGSTDCTITQYGSDDTFWEKSEVLHLSENGEDLCGGGQCTFDVKISDTRSGMNLDGTSTVIVE